MKVTDQNLGTWIYYGFFTPLEFNIKIIEMAMREGYDIRADIWESDKPLFLSGMATQEMLDDVHMLADYSVSYLNEIISDEYIFRFTDAGLSLDRF